jgi:hypothetical protein
MEFFFNDLSSAIRPIALFVMLTHINISSETSRHIHDLSVDESHIPDSNYRVCTGSEQELLDPTMILPLP